MNSNSKQLFRKPVAGNVLTVASGLSFFFTCMLLPLVGRAGSSVPYAGKNQAAFLGMVAWTFLLGALAAWSKLLRRSEDQSPLPIWSLGLCAVCAVLFVLQLSGLLAI
jgi:hypothetical protein